MKKRPIGVFDSGIGGISILNELIRLLPAEDYIFYADTCHNPYGNKSINELRKIVDHIMNYFCKKKVKLVVVACNTVTTQLISYLRGKYPVILFVGVEPAVKMAYDYYLDKNILVLATPATIKSDRMKYLTDTYKQEHRILLSCPGLANIIEKGNLEKLPIYFTKLFKKVSIDKIEVVVLGCTHYLFIKEQIKKSIGRKVIFLDGVSAVAKRVEELLIQNGIQANDKQQGNLLFHLTDKNTKQNILRYLNIQ